jgi:hypothetical protein
VTSARRVSLAIVLARTGVCVYRAATQSIVHDEAFAFLSFLNSGWRQIYFEYNAANHILFSFLAKLSITVLGVSEFSLRFPSVIAGFVLMLGVWRILEFAPSPAVRWTAYLAVALHPLLLDFSIAARGYGLAVALLTWAVWLAMSRRYIASGLTLGLAMSANLVVAFPAAGLIFSVFVQKDTREWRRKSVMALSAAAVTLILYAGVLSTANRAMFYAGVSSLRDAIQNLLITSLLVAPNHGILTAAWEFNLLEFGLLPAILVCIAIATMAAWNRDRRELLIPVLTFFAASLAVLAAHRVISLVYPSDRTGLPWILLFTLAWALAAGAHAWFRCASLALGALLVIQFATQFHTSYFSTWWYDRPMKSIARRLAEDTRGRRFASVAVGATWIHQPALEFYRLHNRITTLRPIERLDDTPIDGADYLILNIQDPKYSAAAGHTILLTDSFAGVVFAK